MKGLHPARVGYAARRLLALTAPRPSCFPIE